MNLSQARQRQFIFSRIGFLSTNIFAKFHLFSKQAIDVGLIKVDLDFSFSIPGLFKTWNLNKPGFEKLNSRSEPGFGKLNSRTEFELSKKNND